MSKGDKEIVSALRTRLVERVGRDRYEVWFGASTELHIGDDALTVVVHNRFFQDWLRANFRKDLEAAVEQVTGKKLAIEFQLDESLQPPTVSVPPRTKGSKSRDANSHASTANQKTLFDISPEVESPEVNGAAAPAAPTRNRRKFSCLSSFVVGDSNRLAHQSALMAAQTPGSMSPLFVYGSSGVGKTHLLESIWTGLKRSQRHAPVVYLSAEQFTTYFQEALHGTGLPNFRRKYRGVETLLVDDLQFFLGKRATISELLHTVDTLLRDGRQLVLAADRPLANLKGLGPELTARIASGVVCKIEPPEFDTRLGIVRTLAAKLELEIPHEVQVYIASQFTSHARELAGALKRLHATSLAHGRSISLRMAEESLADLIHHHTRVLKLADIEHAVCDVFGLEASALQSDRKGKSVSHPRMLAMWLARKHTRAALSEIGHHFGRRTHSTVISAQQKIESWMAEGKSLDLADRSWKLEEAIRRVEEALRAG